MLLMVCVMRNRQRFSITDVEYRFPEERDRYIGLSFTFPHSLVHVDIWWHDC